MKTNQLNETVVYLKPYIDYRKAAAPKPSFYQWLTNLMTGSKPV